LDLNSLKLPDIVVKQKLSEPSSLPPKHNKGEKFLMGPIPWNWIIAVSHLKAKAVHVGIAIWHLAGMTKSKTVKLSGKLLRGMGVNRYAGYRALNKMEAINLITVKRHPGRNPIVTILDAPHEDTNLRKEERIEL
jgi:hypothetical protein